MDSNYYQVPLPFIGNVRTFSTQKCCQNLTFLYNPNTIKSYKILQKLSPKHAAHGVAQSTYPIYRHGKACLSKQPPWRAAGGPSPSTRQIPGSSPGSGGRAARAFFLHPPFLPPSEDSFFCTFPTNPAKVLGLKVKWGIPHFAVPISTILSTILNGILGKMNDF